MQIEKKGLAAAACWCVFVAITGCGGSTKPLSASATARTSTTRTSTAPSGTTTSASASSGGASSGTTTLSRYYGDIATFGGEASGGERAAVVATLHTYTSAIAAGNWAAACRQLSAPIQHQLELLISHARGVHGRDCSAALGALLSRAPGSLRRQLTPLSVIAVRINRDRAFVLYRSPQFRH